MVDIGTSAGTTEVSRITVNEVPGTTTVIGAGTAGGPARKVDIYEDAKVHGNLDTGICRAVKFHLHDGGALSTETPRLSTEVSSAELSVIGAGTTSSQYQRKVKVYDNLEVAHNGTVHNDLGVTHNLDVGNALSVTGLTELDGGVSVTGAVDTTGDVNVGSVGSWGTVRAKNAVVAAGTFHVYDRGAGTIVKMCTGGFGFDVMPGFFGTNVVYGPLTGLFVTMMVLRQTVANPIVTVTPWLCGRYDEASPFSPLFLTIGGNPPAIHPAVTIKGMPAGPMGVAPDMTGCLQQIEVSFWAYTGGPAMIPVGPIPNDCDLVFDVTVVGGICV